MLLKIKNRRMYEVQYDSALLRGLDDSETPRPWDLFEEIKIHASKEKKLLDIGCGTAFKILPLAKYFEEVIGLDPSQSMLEAAAKNAKKQDINNIRFVEGKAEKLPFPDHSIDVISSILSRWDASEIKRVLKPNGMCIVEYIGCEDKKDFKLLFGSDEEGWRGQFIEYQKDEYLKLCYDDFSTFFDTVSIRNGFWDTYYSEEGLKQLLSFTPTIRNYSAALDTDALNEVINSFQTEKGIKLTQNRILIHAKNFRLV